MPVLGELVGFAVTISLLVVVLLVAIGSIFVPLVVFVQVWNYLGLGEDLWVPVVLAFVVGLAFDARFLIAHNGLLARLFRGASD